MNWRESWLLYAVQAFWCRSWENVGKLSARIVSQLRCESCVFWIQAINVPGWDNSLCTEKKVLSPSRTMKVYGGSRGTFPPILSLGIRFRWLVSFMPRPPYPPGKNSGTHFIGSWVGPRDGFDVSENGQIPCPSWDLKTGPSTSTEPFYLPLYNPELFFTISVFLKWRDFRLPLCCEVLDLGVCW